MLLDVHEAFAWVVIAANGLAGLWFLAANWLDAVRVRAMWWFVAVAQVMVFVQVILGVVMVAGQGIEAPGFHMFYGFVAIISIGIIYSYRAQLKAHQYVLYGLGSLFIMGLGIRAVVVGVR